MQREAAPNSVVDSREKTFRLSIWTARDGLTTEFTPQSSPVPEMTPEPDTSAHEISIRFEARTVPHPYERSRRITSLPMRCS